MFDKIYHFYSFIKYLFNESETLFLESVSVGGNAPAPLQGAMLLDLCYDQVRASLENRARQGATRIPEGSLLIRKRARGTQVATKYCEALYN